MCVGGTSIVFQMTILNCYHVYPLREIPSWLKMAQACMSCSMACVVKSRKNDVLPDSSENGPNDQQPHANDDQTGDVSDEEDKDVKIQSPSVEKDSMSSLDVIIKKIKSDEQEENLRRKWKKLARNCDRLLLIIFVSIHLFMILLIILVLPKRQNV